MDDELIRHMRDRIEQLHKVLGLAHDQRMIEIIQKVIDDGEADIAKLEAEREKTIALPPQTDPQG
jgi:hypothetical protein